MAESPAAVLAGQYAEAHQEAHLADRESQDVVVNLYRDPETGKMWLDVFPKTEALDLGTTPVRFLDVDPADAGDALNHTAIYIDSHKSSAQPLEQIATQAPTTSVIK